MRRSNYRIQKMGLTCTTLLGAAILATSCIGSGEKKLRTIEVQRPAKLTIPAKIRRIFIDPAMIEDAGDGLHLKNLALTRLSDRLNKMGRFQVSVGPVQGVDPEKESIGVIQGRITSRQEVAVGQLSEVATCKGGVTGLAGGVSAANTSKQGVTVSRRGYICKKQDLTSMAVEAGVGSLMSLVGVQEVPPVDEVVRIYKYRNTTLFAQLDLSLTMIGKERETITVRSDSADYGRHDVQKAINVHESFMTLAEAAPLIVSPVTALFVKSQALVEASNPGHPTGRWYEAVANEGENISESSKRVIESKLIDRAMTGFIQAISPYDAVIAADIAPGGGVAVEEVVDEGGWEKAKDLLKAIESKDPADLYNLGLAIEATAFSVDDYQEAIRLYKDAFSKAPEVLYAQGIGRVERRIAEVKRLKKQL